MCSHCDPSLNGYRARERGKWGGHYISVKAHLSRGSGGREASLQSPVGRCHKPIPIELSAFICLVRRGGEKKMISKYAVQCLVYTRSLL